MIRSSNRSNWRAKAVSVLGCGCAAAALAACGSTSASSSSTSQTAAASSSAAASTSDAAGKHLTIGGVVFNPADPYWISMKCGAQTEATKLGVSLRWQASPTPEVAPESSALSSVEVTKPNGIMLAPDSPTAFVAPVQTMMRKGTPVAIVDSALASNVGLKNVLTNQADDGSLLAPEIAKAIGTHGKLAIISDKPGAPGAEARFKPLVAILHQKYPGIKILPLVYDQDDSSAVAAQDAQSLIRGNPGLSAIYAINGPMGVGVASGVRAAGSVGKVKVFSFDATPAEVAGVRDGTFTAIMGQSPFLEGSTAIQTLVSYVRSHTSSGAVAPAAPYVANTPVMLIDKSNVNQPATQRFFYSASCSA